MFCTLFYATTFSIRTNPPYAIMICNRKPLINLLLGNQNTKMIYNRKQLLYLKLGHHNRIMIPLVMVPLVLCRDKVQERYTKILFCTNCQSN